MFKSYKLVPLEYDLPALNRQVRAGQAVTGTVREEDGTTLQVTLFAVATLVAHVRDQRQNFATILRQENPPAGVERFVLVMIGKGFSAVAAVVATTASEHNIGQIIAGVLYAYEGIAEVTRPYIPPLDEA